MCNHVWVQINDVRVCKQCGLTFTYDGKVVFDRKIINLNNKKKGRKKK